MKQYIETMQKMINFDDVSKENIKKEYSKLTKIPDLPYRLED